jgi:hypothetical protein
LRKNLVASRLRRLREQGFSTAYHELVDDLDDWPGMIAYCQYKEDKKQACEFFAGRVEDLKDYLSSEFWRVSSPILVPFRSLTFSNGSLDATLVLKSSSYGRISSILLSPWSARWA